MNNDNKFEIKLRSEMYNHNNEKIIKREKDNYESNNLTLAFVLAFILFIVIIVIVALFIR